MDKSFRNILVPDLLNFLKEHPEHTLYFSDTYRSKEEQVDILVKKWQNNTLTGTYSHKLYPAMAKKTKTEQAENHINSIKNTDPALAKAAENFFDNPTAGNAKKVFENIVTENSSRHIRGAAMDISGSWNKDHKFKRALVEYLNNTGKYRIYLYIKDSTKYTAANGVYKVYRTEQVIPPNEVFTNLAKDTNWFFHVEQYRASV